jgi:hypothetical protein
MFSKCYALHCLDNGLLEEEKIINRKIEEKIGKFLAGKSFKYQDTLF